MKIASVSPLLQSVREAGDVQLWALDDGQCMGSISLQTHVSAIITGFIWITQYLFSPNHKYSNLCITIWYDFTSGDQYGMLPRSAVCCCRDSHWRCPVCGDDYKTEAQISSQSSFLPCPCRPFSVSFLAAGLFALRFL